MNIIEKSITLKDGRVITLETGKLAKQADGAVMLKMGNTMLLATVCSAQEAGPDVDFMIWIMFPTFWRYNAIMS